MVQGIICGEEMEQPAMGTKVCQQIQSESEDNPNGFLKAVFVRIVAID